MTREFYRHPMTAKHFSGFLLSSLFHLLNWYRGVCLSIGAALLNVDIYILLCQWKGSVLKCYIHSLARLARHRSDRITMNCWVLQIICNMAHFMQYLILNIRTTSLIKETVDIMLRLCFGDLFDEIKVLFCLARAGLSNRDNQISLPSFVNGNQFTQDTQFQRKKKMFPFIHDS